MNWVIWILCGILAGWLAGLIVKGRGFGLLGDFVIGILGAVVGGWLVGALRLGFVPRGLLGEILVAVFGAVVLVAAVRLLRRV